MSIIHKATDTSSMKVIARSCAVSITTVSRYINEAAQFFQPRPFDALPEHLMMDEYSSVKNVDGKMSFIFADAVTHRIVDLTPDRRLFVLKDYFTRYSLDQRKAVKTVTIDMYEPYMSLINDMFPKTYIIIDRFHIVQSLNRALNMARVELMNTFRTTNRPLYNKFKRYWRLILKPSEQLDAIHYDKRKLFKSLQSAQSMINYLLDVDENFKAMYLFVHGLGFALRTNNYEQFYRVINNTDTTCFNQKLKTVIRTFKKYESSIKNTFTFETLTNGPIEGINNKTKTLKRVAYGYRNWNNMRNRLIIINKFLRF